MARVSMRVLVSVCDNEFHRGLNEQINIFTHTHAERERERDASTCLLVRRRHETLSGYKFALDLRVFSISPFFISYGFFSHPFKFTSLHQIQALPA